jgi:uncharacterized protein
MKAKNRGLLAAAIAILLLALIPPGAAHAAEDSPRFIDEERLLSASRAAELNAKLDEISDWHRFDTVVAVVRSLGGKDARVFAADYYEQKGFGFGDGRDGIILLLATEYRDFAFVTTGYGLYAFTDAGQEYLERLFLPHLRENDYFGAFMAFADAVDDFMEKAEAGAPYDRGNIPSMTAEQKNNARLWSAIAGLIVALIVPAIVTGIWKSKLKTVRKQDYANAYIREGSMALTVQQEVFLYRNVSKTVREKSSNGSSGSSGSFKSSSGSDYSGRSGKY